MFMVNIARNDCSTKQVNNFAGQKYLPSRGFRLQSALPTATHPISKDFLMGTPSKFLWGPHKIVIAKNFGYQNSVAISTFYLILNCFNSFKFPLLSSRISLRLVESIVILSSPKPNAQPL